MKAADTIVPAALAAGGSLAAGTVLGVPIAALVFGLAGGIVALTWARTMKWPKLIGSLVASTLSGGALGPAVGFYIHVDGMPPNAALVAASFIVGAGFQAILQAAIASVENRIRQFGGVKKDQQP